MENINLTNTLAGLAAIQRAMAGEDILFTRLEIGDGVLINPDVSGLTGLINKTKEYVLGAVKAEDSEIVRLRSNISNAGVTQDLIIREYGIYAKFGNEQEFLFAYLNVGDLTTPLPNQTIGRYELNRDFVLYIGNSTHVDFTSNGHLVYLTFNQFKDYEKSKQDITKYSERSGNIGTYNRIPYQKSFHFLGDSHTYGQGTRGDYGLFKAGTHTTRYGARTWSTMLKDYLQSIWNFYPKTYNGVLNNATDNRILETSGFTVEHGKLVHGRKSNYTPTEQDILNVVEKRFTATEIQRFNYNATVGNYFDNYSEVYADSVKENMPATQAFVPTDYGFSVYDGNGRWAIKDNIVCLDGQTRSIPYLIVPVGSKILDYLYTGKAFRLSISGGLYGEINCFVEDVLGSPNGSKPVAVGFSYQDGTFLNEAQLRLIFNELYKTATIESFDKIVISAPVNSPMGLVGFSLFTGKYQYYNYVVTFDPSCYEAKTNNIYGDAYCISTTEPPNLIKKVSDNKMNPVNLVNEGITRARKGQVDEDWSGYIIDGKRMVNGDVGNEFECRYYWLYFKNAITGTLRITTEGRFNGEYRERNTYAIPSLLTRGFQVNDMTKIMTHGFGCHSVGDLIGRTSDICSHDGGIPFDHVEIMRKCELINDGDNRFGIYQAPMVNEYLRQTPIAQYKADLDVFYKKFFEGSRYGVDYKRFIIFTGAGQVGHDDYLGHITTSNPITYAMYRQATKEWAESKGVTYVDAAYEQKKLIEKGEAVAGDFIMTLNDGGTGELDSNHPTMYTQVLWFEALKDIVLRKFQ